MSLFPNPPESPLVLTIGNFDGVHKGHLSLIEQLKKRAQEKHTPSALLTFLNHPSTILSPDNPLKTIYTQTHKKKLLEEQGIKHLFFLPFTKEFSQFSSEKFLSLLQDTLNLNLLLLGYDSAIGKDRIGNRSHLEKIKQTLPFQLEYFPPLEVEKNPISSSTIRTFIKQGDLKKTALYLGRPYSILGTVQRGKQRGTALGFPTINLDLSELCLPPFGVYRVDVLFKGQTLLGAANIGIAPTIREDLLPLLEVHILDFEKEIHDEQVEVIFHEYIRPEKKYLSQEELKKQIRKDIENIRASR